MDIGNSILVHREFERGKSIEDNGGPVRVILTDGVWVLLVCIKAENVTSGYRNPRKHTVRIDSC